MTTTWDKRLFEELAVPEDTSARHRVAGLLYDLAKRFLDVVVAAVALLVLLPLFVVVMVAVRLSSPGPALFRQTRIGRRGKPFTMLKLRTMYTGSDDSAHRRYVTDLLHGDKHDGGQRGLYKLSVDPRITPVGSFLRRTSLDELPQLVNVLRGYMSLVGPRPVLPFEADEMPAEYASRFRVKPGITGLWQVGGRNRLTILEGLDLDVEYVQRRSFGLDLVILLRTVPTIVWSAITRRDVR